MGPAGALPSQYGRVLILPSPGMRHGKSDAPQDQKVLRAAVSERSRAMAEAAARTAQTNPIFTNNSLIRFIFHLFGWTFIGRLLVDLRLPWGVE